MHHQYLDPDTLQVILKTPNPGMFHAAVALAIAYSLPLPSQPVDSHLGYFDEHYKAVAENLIGVFTEVRPVPMRDTVENARAFWNARYAVAHGSVLPQITAGSGMNPTVLSIFGISYNVPVTVLEYLQANAAQIEPVFAKILSAMVRTNMVTAVQAGKA